MKSFVSLMLMSITCLATAQETRYQTIQEAPGTWRPELIPFPLEFAPSLDYSGFEDIRFAPGWADTTATDYFTYTFTWVLDKNPKLNKDKLETQMKAYFDGLMAVVSERNDLPKTKASFNFARAKKDFAAKGQITFYEAFFRQKVITLNVTTVGERCKSTGKYLVRFDLSPKPLGNEVWTMFDEVSLKMDCGK